MEIRKDVGWYCWLVIAAIFFSMIVLSISTYGTISVLVYIWTEKFNISTEVVVMAPSVMSGSLFLLGTYTPSTMHAIFRFSTIVSNVLLKERGQLGACWELHLRYSPFWQLHPHKCRSSKHIAKVLVNGIINATHSWAVAVVPLPFSFFLSFCRKRRKGNNCNCSWTHWPYCIYFSSWSELTLL